jgi:hypothetical protein
MVRAAPAGEQARTLDGFQNAVARFLKCKWPHMLILRS